VVDQPVRVSVQGEDLVARLHDICRDAALVASERVWPLGTEVGLAMQLPGADEVLEVGGTVVRLATGAEPSGMAVLFSGLTPSAATRIDLFIAEREAV
jgi:hypothetical protein